MITIWKGDTPTLQLTAKDLDLTGATFETKIVSPDGTATTIGNSAHTADPDQAANKGKFSLALTAEQTNALAASAGYTIKTRVTQSGQVNTFQGAGILTVEVF